MAKWIENDILNNYEFLNFDEKYQSVSIGVHEFIKRTLIAFDKTAVATLTVVHRINPFRAASRLSLILSREMPDFLTQFRNFFKKSAEVQEKASALCLFN